MLILIAGCLLWGPGSAGSGSACAAAVHPFVQTIADVFVNRSRVTVRLSSSADELDLIHGILPYEETGNYDKEELLEGVDIHADFLLERFEIYDASGNKLQGRVVERPDWEIPEEGIPSGRLIDYMLDYTFEYELAEQPEYLTFQNNIIDFNFTLPSEVNLRVKQAGSDVPYGANLKIKEPETIRFDWDKPLSRELSGEELAEWFEDTREKTLGLTSYGGTYSFVYVTPREVRHEVLIPLASLATIINFDQEDRWYLEIEEQDRAKPLIEAFFSEGNPVSVNGTVVQPQFDRIDFGGLDVRDFATNRERKRISLANGRVGVIMSFPTRNVPDTVSVTWDKFSKMLKDVDVILIGPDDSVEKSQFSRFLTENTIEWNNPGIPPLPDVFDVEVDPDRPLQKTPLPIVSLICGALILLSLGAAALRLVEFKMAAAVSVGLLAIALMMLQYKAQVQLPGAGPEPVNDGDAGQIFSDLHTNLFRAFDYKTEEDTYDALARTTNGSMLQDIYLKMRKSLEIKEQGGAISKIEGIEILDGVISAQPVAGSDIESPDFSYRCKWTLAGSVEHWGHIHRRTNQYEALFNVRNVDGYWKFTEYQPLDEQQGQVIRDVRKF
ncbi:MAG: hypothetical protein ACR2NP_03315 [Pirellulaceae bacterium]